MKTTLAIASAVVLPGGLLVLACLMLTRQLKLMRDQSNGATASAVCQAREMWW